MRVFRAMTLLSAAVLTGCVLRPPEPLQVLAPVGADAAEMRLVEAAERAGRALAALARALPPPDAQAAMPALDAVPEALRRPVTIDWTGPLEALAAGLARRAGYRFHAAGPAPARPVIVAVRADGEPLIAVLRDAGLRAGGAATLRVDAAREAVVLDWAVPLPAERPGEDSR